SAASVLAPLAVAGALAGGLGWRAGYLAAPLGLLAVVALFAWHVPIPDAAQPHDDTPIGSRAALIGPWIGVVRAVSVEFCMVFWAASAVGDWHHASAGLAPAVASLFLVGMAVGRSFAVPVSRRLRGHRPLMLTCVAIAGGGFALFWA